MANLPDLEICLGRCCRSTDDINGLHVASRRRFEPPLRPELRKIADQTPLYSGSQRTGEHVVLKEGMAYFVTYYRCDAQFADIQAFYARVLPQQGWTPPKRTNSFMYDMNDDHYGRGDYFIAVERDSRRSNNFSIVFIWSRQ